MQNATVQLQAIALENFKNVKYGRIHLQNNKKKTSDTVLAIYGQNGSGKTALIQAIELFRYLGSHVSVPKTFCDFIHVDCDYAKTEFEFQLFNHETAYNIFYECKIRRQQKEEASLSLQSTPLLPDVEIFDEVLSYSYKSDSSFTRKTKIIDTSSTHEKTREAFLPLTKYKQFVKNDLKTKDEIRLSKKRLAEKSLSFIFQKVLLRR